MNFLYGTLGLAWMTVLYSIVLFPITILVLLLAPSLIWVGYRDRRRGPIPSSVVFPAAWIAAILAWGTYFSQTPRGAWQGYRWPATVALGMYLCCCVMAWRTWRSSGHDTRVSGLLLVQLWFGAVATFVVASAISPGSGLGAI